MQQVFNASLLSNAEYFRLNGTLPGERIEALLDGALVLDQIDSVPGELDEARGSFPGEDFAEGVLQKMHTLAKRVRGENQKALRELIEELSQLQTIVAGNTEYGLEKIESVRDMVTSRKS